MVERGMGQQEAGGDDRQPERDRDARPAHQRPREHRRDGDAVEDPEVDEAAGEDEITADGRGQRAGGDQRDAPPELHPRGAGHVGADAGSRRRAS